MRRILISGALTIGVLATLPVVAHASAIAAVTPRLAARDLGPLSPASPISIAVTLEYRNAGQLERLIELQNDPSSPYYRHWLTSEQFNASFAPVPSQYRRAMISLQRAGFRIVHVFSNRTVIDAAGTVAAAERYFGTRIDRVEPVGRGVGFANVKPASVPADLRDVMFSVTGLSDVVAVHTDIARLLPRGTRVKRMPAASSGPPLHGPVSSATGANGYGPAAFISAYDFPGAHSANGQTYDGTGRAAGIVIDANVLDADVKAYLHYFGITRTAKIIRVPIDGGPNLGPGLSNPDSVEATLDTETIAGTAPGATVYVYELPSLTSPIYETDGYNAVVSANKVDTLNSSFGICELQDPSADLTWDHIAAQAAALGMTFHASTGDDGAAGCFGFDVPKALDAPASGAHVVGVGGTTLTITSNGGYQSESGWGSGKAASGGGVSYLFPMPPWQKGVATMQPWYRNLPDVSFDADPNTGAALYYGRTWNSKYNPAGGTSLSSPLFGAALVEIDQVLGGRTGLAAEYLFRLWKFDGYNVGSIQYFHDITSGDNTFSPTPSYTVTGYSAGTGYDNVTGIGSLDVWNVAHALHR